MAVLGQPPLRVSIWRACGERGAVPGRAGGVAACLSVRPAGAPSAKRIEPGRSGATTACLLVSVCPLGVRRRGGVECGHLE